MKKHVFPLFIFFVFFYLLLLRIVLSDAASCSTGYIGDQCCGLITSGELCIENIDWGYCDEYQQPVNCTDGWSSQCCCNGTAALSCSVPGLNPGDIRMWGDNDCGRSNATIDCDGIPNNHYICNSTYYPPETGKCNLLEPIIKSYLVSKTNIKPNENFSISVFNDYQNGLSGKYLIECKVSDPNENSIYLSSWDNDSLTTMPNITCSQTGNYIVNYCGIFTDFIKNKGWGSIDDNNTTISCSSTPDSKSPIYTYDSDDSKGNISTGEKVNLSVRWEDNVGLGKALIRINITGSWQNYASCFIFGPSSWCNQTIDTTGYTKKTCWNQWANDTSDNWNGTMPENIHCFNIISSVETTSGTNVESELESNLESLRRSVSSSTAEFTTKFLTLAFQFFGIIILVVLLVLVVQQLVQSHG
jgi:hypothetical protein